jgi:hypothetical protein
MLPRVFCWRNYATTCALRFIDSGSLILGPVSSGSIRDMIGLKIAPPFPTVRAFVQQFIYFVETHHVGKSAPRRGALIRLGETGAGTFTIKTKTGL